MKRFLVAEPGVQYERGLYIAPWKGPDSEIVLLALRADRRLAAPPLLIPWGADAMGMAEELQQILDESDPPFIRLLTD